MIEHLGQPEPGSIRPFGRATRAAGLVFVSGTSAPHDPMRGVHRGATPQEPVRTALREVAAILEAAGNRTLRGGDVHTGNCASSSRILTI